MRERTGYTPGFFTGERLVERRPSGTMRALNLRRRARLPRRLTRSERRQAAKISKKTWRAVRKTARAAKGVSPEQRLIQRATMGWSLVEAAAMAELGYQDYLERQLDYESIDDSALEDVLADAFPSLAMTPYELDQNYSEDSWLPMFELMMASFFRAVYSPRQLYQRMIVFWSDHFSIDIFAGHGYLLRLPDHREVARSYAMATFPEILDASAHSPSMLEYLTNDTNVKGHPNENYARELMELHTMGVDGGYTQKDVREVARCFTGWTLHDIYAGGTSMGSFRFDRAYHDQRKKKVLGRNIPAGGGEEDGQRVLEILAGRPETAEFIARKLLRYLWGYEPGKGMVNKVARKYLATGGDIRAMLRVALARKRMKRAQPKLKRPFHLMASAARASFGDVQNVWAVIEQLELAGHLPFAWSPPNGYPDSAAYWSGFILPRWNFAADFAFSGLSGIEVDPTLTDDGLKPKALVRRIDRTLFNGTLSGKTKAGLEELLKSGKLDQKRIRETLGLAIASPEFQLY